MGTAVRLAASCVFGGAPPGVWLTKFVTESCLARKIARNNSKSPAAVNHALFAKGSDANWEGIPANLSFFAALEVEV